MKMTFIKNIKPIIIALVFAVSMLYTSQSQAQSYYGYQSIGKNVFLFSLIWQGEPKIGFGYIAHITGGKTATDLQIEARFPLKTIFRLVKYEVIAGIYKDMSYSRAFVGVGGHFRWDSDKRSGQRVQKLSLAITGIPSYVYSANTSPGGIYGTLGLRLTYAPVIFANAGGNWNFFPQHKFEGGLHFDMLIDLTAGLALNGITTYYLNSKKTFLKEEKNWGIEGDFYFGTTYLLNRD